MNEVRFRVQPVRAGSAAQAAEEGRAGSGVPRISTHLAGSAARMAAERNAEGAHPTQRPGFSLRAQGGKVMRTDAAEIPPASTTLDVQAAAPHEPAAPQRASRATEEPAGSPHPSSAGLLQGFSSRLKSIFRGANSPE